MANYLTVIRQAFPIFPTHLQLCFYAKRSIGKTEQTGKKIVIMRRKLSFHAAKVRIFYK